MVLCEESHFMRICDNSKKGVPVHFLKYDREREVLTWVKSKGDLGVIQKFVERKQDLEWEEDFCKGHNNAQHILVSGSPGIGKSTFLGQTGRTLEAIYPERAVFFLEIRKFVENVRKVEGATKENAIRKALLESVCENEIGKAVLKSKLDSRYPSVHLLLDGFDEINSEEDRAFALELFKTIVMQLKSIRLCIASRSHLLEKLENTFNVMGYNIEPFDEDNQVQFLTSFWSSQRSGLDTKRIKQFAQHCIDSLKENMSSSSNDDEDIAGIPLQSLLIGLVYESYASLDNGLSTAIYTDIRTNFDLYKRLVKVKYELYQTKYGVASLDKQTMMEMHAQLAFNQVFGVGKSWSLRPIFPQLQMEEVIKFGIVEGSSSTSSGYPKFLHGTIAEYIVAWFVTNRMEKRMDNLLAKFLLDELLSTQCTPVGLDWRSMTPQQYADYQNDPRLRMNPDGIFSLCRFNYPVVAYFVNSFIFKLEPFPSDYFSPDIVHLIICACANKDYVNILKFLIGGMMNGMEEGKRKWIFKKQLVYLSIEKSSLEFVKIVLGQFEMHQEFDLEMKKEALRLAAKRGDFAMAEYFINFADLQAVLKGVNQTTKWLLHECLANSDEDSPRQIDRKVQMIRWLCKDNPELFKIQSDFGQISIFNLATHIKLMLELIRQGANLSVRGPHDMTVIHLDDDKDHLSPDEYEELLSAIPKEVLQKLINVEAGPYKYTPLISILIKMNPTQGTLQIFKDVGADFKCHDKYGISALAMAVRCGRNVNTIRSLVEIHPDGITWRGQRGESLLHIAAEAGNVGIITELINLGAEPLARNNKNELFITSALYKCFGNKRMGMFYYFLMRIPKELLSSLVKVEDGMTLTALMRLVKLTDPSPVVLTLYKNAGANFNCVDEDGYSLLANVICGRKAETIRKLIECGADLYWKEREAPSPLCCKI